MPRKATGTTPVWSDRHACWCVRACVPANTGPRITIPLPDANTQDEKGRALAIELAPQFIAAMRRDGVEAPKAEPAGETFEAWADRWCDARKAKGLSTVPNDRGHVKNHFGSLRVSRMVAITTPDIERVVGELDAKVRAGDLSAHTAANAYGTLTQMFKDACSAKVVPGVATLRVRAPGDNPTRDVAGPDRGEKKSKVYLYPSEFLRLVSCVEVDREFRRLVAVDVYLYLRASELGALDLEDLDEEHGAAHVHRSLNRVGGGTKGLKGKEARHLPIEPTLVPLLRAIRAERKSGRLFPDMPRVDKLALTLREALTVAGITRADLFTDDATRKPLTFHDLRSTGITFAAIRGDDPLKIQRRAGHKMFDTTAGYIREAENLTVGFGEPFPALPAELIGGAFGHPIGPDIASTGLNYPEPLDNRKCGQQDLNL